jgi:uncharacterized protein (DUF885 family)
MLLLASLVLWLGTGPVPAQTTGSLFQEIFEERLADHPEFATQVGRREYDDRWTDLSAAGRARSRAHLERRLEQLRALPTAGIPAQDRLTVRVLEYDLRAQLDARELETHLLSVGQLFGLHTRVYSTIDRMPARTERDYRNILARLRAVPAYVDQNIAVLEEAIARGMTQPRVVVELVSGQLAAQAAQDHNATALTAAFRRFPSNLPPAVQARLRAEAEEAYDREFLPAWHKLHAFFTGRYMASARPGDGIGSMRGGREAYATLVRRLTTTTMTPEEIHKLGEREMARIEAEMLAVIRQAGFAGTVAEYARHLDNLPGQHFRDKEEMLAYCRNIAKIIEPELPRLFKRVPVLLYGVRAIPPDREAATATHAQTPAPDYSAPGWFNLNAYQPGSQVKYTKESLTLHEAVPGHIFQGTLAQALPGLPEVRRFYSNSAYGEGWALYAESLGAELGVYRDAPSRFGQLASERFRAVRLVVDTGLHALGWTRERAIDFFGTHAPDSSLAEVDRYISWPAQALAYKIGQVRMRELRAEAERRLGTKFDVREFHEALLRNGPLPLDLLSEQVEEYIKGAEAVK